VGFASLLATGLLPLRAKREAARVLGALPRTDPAPWRRRSLGQWLEATVSSVEVRELLLALARLATFTHDPDRVSAGAVLEQLRLGRKGVLYLHGGWQTLVEGLRQVAVAAGAQVVTAAPVTSVERNTAVTGLRLADGARVRARAVVIAAGGPREALRLLGDGAAPSLAAWAAATVPVKAACLDVALARLPRPRALFALGIDAPLYASVHSAVARLAPTGGALLHTLRYRSPDGPADARGDERELERLLDRLQPGWRDHVVDRRFLPDMTVSHALVTAPGGGTGGRPGTPIAEVPGVFIAGDWVGDEGLLADAALASARRAAGSVLAAVDRGVSAA
jgi:phytoene dehydrogenase-like protein